MLQQFNCKFFQTQTMNNNLASQYKIIYQSINLRAANGFSQSNN